MKKNHGYSMLSNKDEILYELRVESLLFNGIVQS